MELLLTERMIIESISKGRRTIRCIEKDTKLSEGIVNSVIPELIMKNIVTYSDGVYSINLADSAQWINKINKFENYKNELKDILSASVELLEKKDTLKLKKVFLSDYEEKLLNIELKRIDNFIAGIQKEKRGVKKTSDMKVVYWGSSNYGDLVKEDLKYI